MPGAIKTLQMDSIDVELWYHDKFLWTLEKINAVFGFWTLTFPHFATV